MMMLQQYADNCQAAGNKVIIVSSSVFRCTSLKWNVMSLNIIGLSNYIINIIIFSEIKAKIKFENTIN